MHFIEDVLWLLVLIGVMINIHEAGHYFAARWFDVKIEAFSFGFGTRLFGFRRGETDFRFSAIPFGGYVKMAGERASFDENSPRTIRAIDDFHGQAALAAPDHRLRRSVHEPGAGGGHPDRHVHGEIREVFRRRHPGQYRPRDAQLSGRQGGHSGRRPDRQAGWGKQSHLGRRGAEGSHGRLPRDAPHHRTQRQALRRHRGRRY
jgi:hypothetical protein